MARKRVPSQGKPELEWEFYRFPTIYGFAVGAFVGVFLLLFLGQLGFVIALFGLSFATAHLLSHNWRHRTAGRRRAREEEEVLERRALAARGVTETGEPVAVPAPARRRRKRR
jgi:hypothetical protein